jgi:hypothetical protein
MVDSGIRMDDDRLEKPNRERIKAATLSDFAGMAMRAGFGVMPAAGTR